VVLFFLDIAAFVVVIVAWFAILFTGSYPRGVFGFVEEVIRWNIRVTAYTLTLVTDRYPPVPAGPLGSPRGASPPCCEHQAVQALLARRGWVRGSLLPDFALRNQLVGGCPGASCAACR
jgi:hypothetical protein